jgi:hypothetical protein
MFLDAAGVPTLVEVKRSTDSRSRREVVAQMLDYAAFSVAHVTEDGLKAAFEATCRQRRPGVEPNDVLSECIGDEDVDEYWRRVGANLRAGRIRMVFVADRISREVQRIVEFLNDQLERAEVLAVEIRRHVSPDGHLLMFNTGLVGQTARAQARKSTVGVRADREWTVEAVLSDLETRIDEGRVAREALAVAKRVLAWASNRGVEGTCSGGPKEGSVQFHFPTPRGSVRFLLLYSHGSLNLSFGPLASAPPFTDAGERRRLVEQLERIDGVGPLKADGRTAVKLSVLHDDEAFSRFFGILGSVLDELRGSVGGVSYPP